MGVLVETALNLSADKPASTPLRLSALSYLSSLVARASYIPHGTVARVVECLVHWISSCTHARQKPSPQLYDAAVQSALYILTARWRVLDTGVLGRLTRPLLRCASTGVRVDPAVSREFCRVMHALGVAYAYPFFKRAGPPAWFPFDGAPGASPAPACTAFWTEYVPPECMWAPEDQGAVDEEEELF